MKLTRLYRNLKKGDKFVVRFENKSTIVVVSSVNETRRFHFSGKRCWEIHANYPWWFPGPIRGYSTDKIEIFRDKT